MKFTIRGEKIEITDAIREYATEKLSKLEKYFDNPDNVNVKVIFSIRGREQKVEITINANNYDLRAEVSHSDMYAAIDLAIDKLVLFNDKLLKYIGLTISILLALFFGIKVILNRPTYEPIIRCASEENPYNEKYKVSLEDKKYGEVFLKYEEKIDAYCLQAKFIRSGKTKLTIEDSNGKKQVYDLRIGQTSYTLSEIE